MKSIGRNLLIYAVLSAGMCIFTPSAASAQEIVVTGFELKVTDLTAKIDPVYDLNDEACALIKVAVAGKNVIFTGDIVGEPTQVSGEWLVFMPQHSKRLKVAVEGYLPITYEFPVNLESFRTYSLRLKLVQPAKKVSVGILPSFSYTTNQYAYGVMITLSGKKHGGFVHAKSDFNFLTTDGETSSKGWYTGNYSTSRLAVTAGYMLGIGKHFYPFVGAGYGYRTLAWESMDGVLQVNKESSTNGVEAELGFLLRFGAFSLGISAQSSMFKIYEANAFIGVMF